MPHRKSILRNPDRSADNNFAATPPPAESANITHRFLDYPTDLSEILEFEISLSNELRNLIERAISTPGTTLLTRKLPHHNLYVDQIYQAGRDWHGKFMPAVMVKGPTCHDGIFTGQQLNKMTLHSKHREIKIIRRLTFRQIKNIVVSEFCIFEVNDRHSRVLKNRAPETIHPRGTEKAGRFHQSTTHTLYTENKDRMDRFLELFHHYRPPQPL